MTTDVSSLADILRGEDTNTAISDGDPQDRGNHIAATTKNAVNRAKKEEKYDQQGFQASGWTRLSKKCAPA